MFDLMSAALRLDSLDGPETCHDRNALAVPPDTDKVQKVAMKSMNQQSSTKRY